ncbi:MAG: tail fiber domain-containing protein [Proteobacteria bacterium]|nr:tail fiber domain-containing protein [Pseudomonadota bacterium]NBP13091.1 tail fiber domain-containing protein [bacterium]
MAVATISVNFANSTDTANGSSNSTSINPAVLKDALQSGSSFYNISINGATFNNNVTIAAGGLTITSGVATIGGGLTVNSGGVAATGNSSIDGTLTVSGVSTFTNGTTSSSPSNGAVVITGGLGVGGPINAAGDITAYATSDVRLKTNVTTIESALDKILKLSGIKFDWKPESGHEGTDYGVLAHEVEAVLPEIVTTRPGEEKYKAVRYEKLIPVLIEAIKELASKSNCGKCSREV